MDQQLRRSLESVAYGRGSTDAERATALAELKAAELAEVLRVQPTQGAQSADVAVKPRRRARWTWAAFATLGVTAVAVAAAVLLAPSPRTVAEPPRGRADPILAAIVPVGEDLLANPPDERVQFLIDAAAGLSGAGHPAVKAATALGEREGNVAVGVLTADGQVCILLLLAPEASGAGGTSSQSFCATGPEFTRDGVVADRGAWDVHWYSDGTVAWNGI